MGVLFDYFRAPEVEEVRRKLDENEGYSPVPEFFDGVMLKTIDPGVILAQMIAMAADREWSADLVSERLIWPMSADRDLEYQGPWVTGIGDPARDALAGIEAGRAPELAERWAGIEEFFGDVDTEYLAEVIIELGELAARARAHGESLYCWSSL
ncbi:hypothetical protein ACWT_1355 [Actinoplanes sp. SE50]|uniref:hypothetical protein n=1 Tax=unclassified Actinoplanes TaxID=2626549 RepID=UPI00023EBE93|nr:MULTISPECIES: hypothetical protein [unclassified Actinoplanes]AEV82373.1 hypothetical protein ACPL_1476 [Actinoplanes sp. SE50/110]ATO80770.1 hypothetical protein ACWT_1355 [Actinoplanes sp. SE50]SLL98178.1 hypothetical protein ACSP50_1402 [Actinoplanes sp. SE50/110]